MGEIVEVAKDEVRRSRFDRETGGAGVESAKGFAGGGPNVEAGKFAFATDAGTSGCDGGANGLTAVARAAKGSGDAKGLKFAATTTGPGTEAAVAPKTRSPSRSFSFPFP